MRHVKVLKFISSLAAALTLIGVAGCASSHQDSDRTAGRVDDDNRITKQVKEELTREPTYKFSDVDVKTFDGVVQLSGFVNTDDQKRRAGEIAQHTQGVGQVVNSITLKPQTGSTPTGRPNSSTYPDQPRSSDVNPPRPSDTTPSPTQQQ